MRSAEARPWCSADPGEKFAALLRGVEAAGEP